MTSLAPSDEPARRAHFIAQAERLRLEMEDLAGQVRALVVAQPPVKLLGYVLSLFQMANMSTFDEKEGPDRDVLKTFQFVLEYLHAVWSSHSPLADESIDLDEPGVTALMEVLERLATTTMMYCMASSAAVADGRSAQTEFHAKSSWALIRGHRYQVLEDEFFSYVLGPHAEALREAYGMEPEAIAKGLQNISDAFRSGFSDAVENLFAAFDRAVAEVEATGADLGAVVKGLSETDPNYMTGLSASAQDMFFGGVCNLSRHSSLSAALLEDLSFEPGQDARFFAPGEFAGTPMRTLPGRTRPGIKLGDAYYATDGQFVRDSAYRAIQWGLWGRLPYRDEWLKRQARVVEQAFPAIFASQLDGAQIYEGVYYRDPQTGDWAETDLVIALDDVLVVVEARRLRDHIFEEDNRVPIYTQEGGRERRGVRAVFRRPSADWWFDITIPDGLDASAAQDYWTTLSVWLTRTVPIAEAAFPELPAGAIRVECDFTAAALASDDEDGPTPNSVADIRRDIAIAVDVGQRTVDLVVGPAFERGGLHADNIAEQALVGGLLAAMAELAGDPLGPDREAELMRQAAPDPKARQRHQFAISRFLDTVREDLVDRSQAIDPIDEAVARLGLGWRVRDRSAGAWVRGKTECTAFLNAVVRALEDEIAAELRGLGNEHRTLSIAASQSLLDFLTLAPRSGWRGDSAAVDPRDLDLWRPRRTISVLRRPLLQIDDGDDPTLLFAPGLVRNAVRFMIGNYLDGSFPDWQLRPAMVKWRAREADRRGRAFSESVAGRLKADGWTVADTDLKVTKALDQGFDVNPGDIDVLAWRRDPDRVLVIECKDVQFKRTLGEIAEQLADFRGEAVGGKRDYLRKHLDRMELLRCHQPALARFIGWDHIASVESHLVFKNPVPVQYALKRMASDVMVSTEATLLSILETYEREG